MKRLLAWVLAAFAGLAAAAERPAPLRVAWLDAEGALHASVLDTQGRAVGSFDAGQPVPLGSLWKLVAYAQWLEAAAPPKPLQCQGHDPEEVYCCAPGESIARGAALAKSCGLYFARSRVPWDHPPGPLLRALPQALAQAVQRGTLGPATQVAPREWLQWLAAWPPGLREQASLDLLGYWVEGAGRRALPAVAAQLRVKTYTVERSDGTRIAGGSGWTAQQRPVWFLADGSSADVVPMRALQVVALTRGTGSPGDADAAPGGGACVRVAFFDRYPLAAIEPLGTATLPVPGALQGRYRLRFDSGTTLEIASRGELQVANDGTHPRIHGEFALDDYVARVLDREAAGEPRQAAWALAIAARTYVLANGTPERGCIAIADASSAQRVAPRPPSAAARAAAQATAGLVLAGGYAIAGQYHRDRAADGVLSWEQARAQAIAGDDFLAILHHAYPRATVATAADHGALACEPLPLVAEWIERERPRWKRQLAGQPGFGDPGELQVCRLANGRSHAAAGTHRIDVSGYRSLEERLAVAHEYVHLAFARHPAGRDERFVEMQARKLIGVLQ